MTHQSQTAGEALGCTSALHWPQSSWNEGGQCRQGQGREEGPGCPLPDSNSTADRGRSAAASGAHSPLGRVGVLLLRAHKGEGGVSGGS